MGKGERQRVKIMEPVKTILGREVESYVRIRFRAVGKPHRCGLAIAELNTPITCGAKQAVERAKTRKKARHTYRPVLIALQLGFKIYTSIDFIIKIGSSYERAQHPSILSLKTLK